MSQTPQSFGGLSQENDIRGAGDLIEGLVAGHVLADCAYDADRFHDTVLEVAAVPFIPPTGDRGVQHDDDKDIEQERNCNECFFNKIRRFWRVATQCVKLRVNFMGFVPIAAIVIQRR